MRYVVFPLLTAESLLYLALFHRRFKDYPLTCIAMLFVAGLYSLLGIEYWTHGALAYREAVGFTRPLFRSATAIMCTESVLLMAQGIPNVRMFAAATSMVFAGLTAAAMLAADAVMPGSGGAKVSVVWSMGGVMYLMGNYWLYSRGRPMNPLAADHALGAMVMMFATAAALGLGEAAHGRGWMAMLGHLVGRVGPIVAVWIWMGRGKGIRE